MHLVVSHSLARIALGNDSCLMSPSIHWIREVLKFPTIEICGLQCTPDISRSCISRNWIYRGRMLDPIFGAQECDIFGEIVVIPRTQFTGDNFSRNLLTGIAFVLGPRETIFRETNSSLPVNAGWNTCCAVVRPCQVEH